MLPRSPQDGDSVKAHQVIDTDLRRHEPTLSELVAERKKNRKWYHYRPGDNGGLDNIGDL